MLAAAPLVIPCLGLGAIAAIAIVRRVSRNERTLAKAAIAGTVVGLIAWLGLVVPAMTDLPGNEPGCGVTYRGGNDASC